MKLILLLSFAYLTFGCTFSSECQLGYGCYEDHTCAELPPVCDYPDKPEYKCPDDMRCVQPKIGTFKQCRFIDEECNTSRDCIYTEGCYSGHCNSLPSLCGEHGSPCPPDMVCNFQSPIPQCHFPTL